MTTKVRRERSLTGVSFAMMAAVLFGASTPFSKILLVKQWNHANFFSRVGPEVE
jgi:hypothetical protein